MYKSFKTLFFLKKGNRYKGGAMPIYVRIIIDGQRKELSIQRSCDPKNWNQKSGRARGSHHEISQLNSYLDAIQGRIFDIQRESELINEQFSPELVKNKLLGVNQKQQHSLIEVYKYHNQQFADLVGKEFSGGTLKKFNSALKSLQNFIRWKFGTTDFPISKLSHQFITDYEFYLKSIQGIQHNTAMGNIKKLKKIVRQCVANDWLDKDPFMSYKIKIRETHRAYLSEEELQTLTNKEFSIARLDQVKDIFLFSCFTGLAYADVMKLSPSDIAIGIDGEKWVFTTRTKTDTASRIPLLPMAQEIIIKYSNHPKAVSTKKLLPTLSNQRLNSYLKEISDACGFTKELTFHCARHTFATTVTLTNGVPIESVSKMLGHKSLRTTQHYAKILDIKVSADMNILRSKFSAQSPQKSETGT
ncbi:MAG: site-specific integrase [Cyclobacteriaceae bacterium]|nr:site-specific integrase [Cyclobacteriaceae bacterium]